MQAAFIEHDGFQCGYCTPGQIMSAVALIDEGHAGSDARDPRVDERQHLPLRRLPQHRRGDPRRRRREAEMQPSALHAPTTLEAALARRRSRRQVHRRRHRPVELMKDNVETPGALVDLNACRSRSIEIDATGCGSARWRA